MEFVFVGGKPTTEKERFNYEIDLKALQPFNFFANDTSISSTNIKCDFGQEPVNIAKNVLISIISGLNQKQFGYNTLKSAIDNLRYFKERYVNSADAKLFIDSGGYSIIVGDVIPTDIPKFIECYVHYLETEQNNYDYIFSLDIPIFLEYPDYNTVQHIEDFNRRSLSESLIILKKYPELANKFYFIYQFKLRGQYEIWNRLYQELDMKSIISNWAIGGMVGLRGILRKDPDSTDINFSPFTALAFKSFYDYTESLAFNIKNFRLHCLGIYIKYDRFQLCLLQKLFDKYLYLLNSNELRTSSQLTYDSVNYMRTAQLKLRDLEIYQFTGDGINRYNDIQNTPHELLKEIYGSNYNNMLIELENLKINKNLGNVDAFVGLNVFSNVQIDKFFDWVIDSYNIVQLFFDCKDFEQFKRNINPILITLTAKWPTLFTSKLITCLTENLRLTYIFHIWWMKDRTEIKLNTLINNFINKINFPGGLK